MSMMNANVAATTAMTANKPLDFELPEMGEAEFSNEELAEDMQNTSLYHVNHLGIAIIRTDRSVASSCKQKILYCNSSNSFQSQRLCKIIQ